jgi:hypothetical protein
MEKKIMYEQKKKSMKLESVIINFYFFYQKTLYAFKIVNTLRDQCRRYISGGTV